MKKRDSHQVFRKLDQDHIRSLGIIKKPTLDYSWRRGAEVNRILSLHSNAAIGPALVNSVMDPMSLAKETPEIRAATIAKSKRIAIAYNKYVSDETDPKTIGRK